MKFRMTWLLLAFLAMFWVQSEGTIGHIRNLFNNLLGRRPDASSKLSSCTCSDYITGNGFGNCKKSDPEIANGLPFCYVNTPSSCTDLHTSRSDRSKKYSALACIVAKQPCQDDPNWRDTKYGGNGEDTCSTMTEKMCNDYGKYSTEARRACPRTCGVCSTAPPAPYPVAPSPPNFGTCSCTSYVSNSGFGNCEKNYGSKGPVCYVSEPSTCQDLQRSSRERDKQYSWEACKNGNVLPALPSPRQEGEECGPSSNPTCNSDCGPCAPGLECGKAPPPGNGIQPRSDNVLYFCQKPSSNPNQVPKFPTANRVQFLKRTGSTCLPYYKMQQASVDEIFNACNSNPNCKGISSIHCETNGLTDDYYQCLSDSQLMASSGCFWEKQNFNEKREVSCYDNCLDSGKDGWECSHRCNGNKDDFIEPDSRSPPPITMPKLSHEDDEESTVEGSGIDPR